VEHVVSLSPQVEKAKELEEFTERLRSLFNVGEPLEVNTRRLMERALGHDLEGVRVHRGYQAEETSRKLNARAFTFSGHIFGPHQNLDYSTGAGLGLLAHELTHVIQQTRPHQMPQSEVANHETGPAPIVPPGGHSNIQAALLASFPSSPAPNLQRSETQAQANEQLVAAGTAGSEARTPPEINREEVANKVYHLMQRDLALERERSAKFGG